MAQDGYGTEFRKQFENLTTIERVAEPALTGRKVYDTDLDRLFIGDGTNWNEIPNAGDLGSEYIETNFLSNIVPATANTSLTDNDNTNPLGLKFSDLRYQAGRTRIEAYSIELTDEYIDNKPTYKIAAGCGPKGFRDQVRFVGAGWHNRISTSGARVATDVSGYILVTGLMDDICMIIASSSVTADDINIEVDGVDTGTNLSTVGSTCLNGYNIRGFVPISDPSISTSIGGFGLHTVKFEVGSGGSYTVLEFFGFDLITTTPIEQAGKAFVGTNETDFTQQTVSDPTITGTKGGKAIRYIDPADSTRKWATQEPDQATVSTTLTSAFNTGTNSLTVADSSDFAVDNLISVHSDDAGYTINELFRVSSIGSSTNITVQDVSTVTDRAGAGYNFPIGTTIEHYGNCDTAIDHSNEVISRSYHPRRFGAGHADDWQYHSGAAAASFILDDGSSSLWSDDCFLLSSTGQLMSQAGVSLDDTDGTDPILTWIFNGTGCALEFNSGTSHSDDADIYLDGVKIVDTYNMPAASRFLLDICSQLPNQTHILQVINRSSVANQHLGPIVRLVEYTSKDPATISSLDKGSLIAKKQLTADYVFNSGTDAGSFSKGCTYYAPNRGWKCTDGSSACDIGVDISMPFFRRLRITGPTTATAETWFYGTGFEIMFQQSTDRGICTLEIDGSTDFSSYTDHQIGTSFTPATGAIDNYNTVIATAYTIGITGLTEGWHKLKVTQSNSKNGSSSNYYCVIGAFGVIGGSACITEPTQSLQQISSCMIGDSQDIRKIKALESEENVVNTSSALGVTSGISTSATSFIPSTDGTVTFKSSGNPVMITFSDSLNHNALGSHQHLTCFVDGVELPYATVKSNCARVSTPLSETRTLIIPLPAGIHTFTMHYRTNTGTLTAQLTQRRISVVEIEGVKNED